MSFYGTRYSMPRKTCKFRLSYNLTKFDVVARFRGTIPTGNPFHHQRSRKISDFYQNYDFALFSKIGIFSGLTSIALQEWQMLKTMGQFGLQYIEQAQGTLGSLVATPSLLSRVIKS